MSPAMPPKVQRCTVRPVKPTGPDRPITGSRVMSLKDNYSINNSFESMWCVQKKPCTETDQ